MAIHPCRTGPGPRPDRLVRRTPARDHLGRPSDCRSPGSRVVREEAAAYPVITGPRTLFEVETPRARLALTYPAPLAAMDDHRHSTTSVAPPERR